MGMDALRTLAWSILGRLTSERIVLADHPCITFFSWIDRIALKFIVIHNKLSPLYFSTKPGGVRTNRTSAVSSRC